MRRQENKPQICLPEGKGLGYLWDEYKEAGQSGAWGAWALWGKVIGKRGGNCHSVQV